jgi:predicted nucleic acid-binding protein
VIVLDASAAIDLLLDVRPVADTLREKLLAQPGQLAAPHLIDAEVGQVLRRHVLRGELTAARARDAFDDLRDLGIQRFPHGPLLGRAFELRDNATVYDALYLALAEALDADLLTRDAALAGLRGVTARVRVV